MLKQIAWSKDYEIVPSLDEQHQQMFALVQAVKEAVETKNRDQILDWLQHILEYSEGHMLYEEALMVQTEYVDTECHIKTHRRILANLRRQYDAVLAGDTEPRDLLVVLDNWARVHVLLEDMAFKEHFLSNKIG